MGFSVDQMPGWSSGKVEEIMRQTMTSTVPFLRSNNERLEHEASGVLVRIADSAFVLTAFHVLKPLLEGKISMLIGAGRQYPAGTSLSGLRVLRADDPFDIALIELSEEQAQQIALTHSFINLAQCDTSKLFEPRQLFFVCGFPEVDTLSSTLRKTLHLVPFGFVTGAYAGDISQLPSSAYRADLHLPLDYSEGNRKDEMGAPIPLPEPRGMSGCGVWRLPSVDIPVECWESDRFRLARFTLGLHTGRHVETSR